MDLPKIRAPFVQRLISVSNSALADFHNLL